MNKIINFLLMTFLFLPLNIEALDYIKKDNSICTETEEYKEWLKLSEKEKKEYIKPIRCEETVKIGGVISRTNFGTIGNVDYKTLTKFDLRNVNGKNYVSAIKDQYETDLCWTFASTDSIESAYLVEGGTTIDLSEKHIAFNTTAKLDDNVFNPLGIYSKPTWDSGGNYYHAGEYLSSGRGPVVENKVSWSTVTPTLDLAMNVKPDYSVDSIKILTNKYCNEDAILNIKYLLATYGTVASIMYGGGKLLDGIDDYLSNNNTAYYYAGMFSNHAVTIVGWDDTYPKENFSESKSGTPERDGAWIVKNTYSNIFTGTEEVEKGYHYISYNDTNICDLVMSVHGISTDITDNQYYYDTIGMTGSIHNKNKTMYFKEVYNKKTSNAELLTKVSLYTGDKGDTYEILYSETDDINNATVIANGTSEGSEYKTLYLESPINITSDKFYIYLKYTSNELYCVDSYYCNSDEAEYFFPVERFTTIESNATEELEYKNAQSQVAFYSTDKVTWNDTLSNLELQFYPILHAFTYTIDYNLSIGKVVASSDDVTLDKGGSYYFPLNLTNITSLKDVNVKIYDSSKNDVTNNFDIEEYESGYKVSVNSQKSKAGDFTIKFLYEKLNVSSIFSVAEKSVVLVNNIKIIGGNEVSVRGTLNLSVEISPADATNKNIIWSSSDDTIATVNENGVVAGIKGGSVKITVKSVDGSNVSDVIDVTVLDINEEEGNGTTPPLENNNMGDASYENPDTGFSMTIYYLIPMLLVLIIIFIKNKNNNFFKKI